MENIKKILFPVDLSEVSPKIAPMVLTMAKQFSAELHLVHVSGTLEQFSSFYIPHPPLDGLEKDLKKAAEKKLKEFEEEYCQECTKIKRVVLQGDPAEQIIRYIESAGIDFVVVGTHGRKGLDRALFGSVAEKVVRGSRAPVMSVNPYK